jgi:hypothetical protein
MFVFSRFRGSLPLAEERKKYDSAYYSRDVLQFTVDLRYIYERSEVRLVGVLPLSIPAHFEKFYGPIAGLLAPVSTVARFENVDETLGWVRKRNSLSPT